jgi:hypothetical protein
VTPALLQISGLEIEPGLLHGSVGDRTEPVQCLCLSDADGLRASKLEHAVQSVDADGDLGRAAGFSPRAQPVADHAFDGTVNLTLLLALSGI